MTNPTSNVNTSLINQSDFLKLFMQELTYQDPMKPIDNREFMAQMAQFSALQTNQGMSEQLERLTGLMSVSLTLDFLNKQVTLRGSNDKATVQKVTFKNDKPPTLTVYLKGSFQDILINDVESIGA